MNMIDSKAFACDACRIGRLHTAEDWTFHPLARHGYTPETGWTSEAAKAQSEAERTKRAEV